MNAQDVGINVDVSPGVWQTLMNSLVETQVNLLTVLVLFVAYGLRELVPVIVKRRHGGGTK